MKKVVLLAVVGLFAASLAFAQTGLGSVGIFGDPMGTNCNLLDQGGPGVKLYYVVHVLTTGASASQYMAKVPACMTGTGAMYLADTNPFPVTLGNSQTGVAVAYGGCRVGPINTQIIQVFGMGLTPPCCRWYVVGDPVVSPQVQVSDCNFVVWPATGGQGVINPDGSCQCSIPTQDTTWGQVKALYE
jgi:hypothetical protein